MEPLVSILTPCYNGEKFISDYVNSIFKQDYSNIEVICVDDGSNDATKQLILGYENEFLARKISFQYIWNEHHGAASAIDKGLKNVKGKYLTWIDVDDSMHSDYFSQKVRFLEENTDPDLVISRCPYIEQSTGETVGCSWKDVPLERKELIHRLLLSPKSDLEPGNAMVRIEQFDALNPQRFFFVRH
jgi:Glycosyltransferases involved in cell wall biogenesis